MRRPLPETATASPSGGQVPAPVRPEEVEHVIGDCAVYEHGRRLPGRLPLARAAAEGGDDRFVWVGLQQPTADEVAAVAAEFELPALAVEDAVKAHQRPKLELYGDVVFVVLKPVAYVDDREVVTVSELAVFVGRTFVVTVRHGESDVLRRVREALDGDGADPADCGPAGVLYAAADLVVDDYERAIAAIDDDVAEIEAQVFGESSHDHAERIYKLKREVLEFRRAVGPLAVPLERLAAGSVPEVPAALGPYFRDVHDHLLRASEAIEGQDRLLTDVLQANVARVSVQQSAVAVRQNEDMRKISAWAAIALVPTAIAGIYGMNFEHMPELSWRYGYYVVLGVIAVACAALYRLFKRNGWL